MGGGRLVHCRATVFRREKKEASEWELDWERSGVRQNSTAQTPKALDLSVSSGTMWREEEGRRRRERERDGCSWLCTSLSRNGSVYASVCRLPKREKEPRKQTRFVYSLIPNSSLSSLTHSVCRFVSHIKKKSFLIVWLKVGKKVSCCLIFETWWSGGICPVACSRIRLTLLPSRQRRLLRGPGGEECRRRPGQVYAAAYPWWQL